MAESLPTEEALLISAETVLTIRTRRQDSALPHELGET